MLNTKVSITLLTVGLIKKHSINQWIFPKYIPKSKSLGANVEIELDLSNYETKADLKKSNRCWYIGFC